MGTLVAAKTGGAVAIPGNVTLSEIRRRHQHHLATGRRQRDRLDRGNHICHDGRPPPAWI